MSQIKFGYNQLEPVRLMAIKSQVSKKRSMSRKSELMENRLRTMTNSETEEERKEDDERRIQDFVFL